MLRLLDRPMLLVRLIAGVDRPPFIGEPLHLPPLLSSPRPRFLPGMRLAHRSEQRMERNPPNVQSWPAPTGTGIAAANRRRVQEGRTRADVRSTSAPDCYAFDA